MQKRMLKFPSLVTIGILLVAIGTLSVLILGCSRPPKKQIEQLIKESLQKDMPYTLWPNEAIGNGGAKFLTLNKFSIITIGKPQQAPSFTIGNKQYWPVRIFAEGTCVIPQAKKSTVYTGEAEYNIFKDAYGKWAVKWTDLRK